MCKFAGQHDGAPRSRCATAVSVTRFLVQVVSAVALSSLPVTAAPPLRILSYNVHHCEGVDGKLDVERIARVIESARPDLVALQEIDVGAQRTGGVDQAAELARLTGMQHVFGGNIELPGGRYGNAVLSRWSIEKSINQRLPCLNQGEQRGVLMVDLNIPGQTRPLKFWATHLDHRRDPAERIGSAQRINEWLAQASLSQASESVDVILAGDLNARRDTEPLQIFLQQWQIAGDVMMPTIPADQPRDQIDFVLLHPQDRWKVIQVTVLEEAVASDHRPILALIEWIPASNSGGGVELP